VKIIPKIVIIKASNLSNRFMLIEWLNTIKVDIIQPEVIVPRTNRFKALVNLIFSSLVGGSVVKEGVFRKQKKIIRNEYTEVNRVASKESVRLIRLASFVSPISSIKSFE